MSGDEHVEAARAVFDASADQYVEFVGTELSDATEGPIDRAQLQAFVELVAQRPLARVADLGCGPGRVAAFLAERGLGVIGVDVSSTLLARARVAHPHVAFHEGRLDNLPIADASLDGAVCWYSIIYTPPARLDAVFGELARVIKPGGHLLLAFQEGAGEAAHRADVHGTGLALTSYRHDLDALARQVRSAGFDVHATTSRAPEFEHETTDQAFVFARRL